MGSWGYEPMDSDGALDWLGENVTDHVGLRIRHLLNLATVETNTGGLTGYADELRAAADVAIKLNYFSREDLYGDIFGDLAAALDAILVSNWTEDWTDVGAIRQSLIDQIATLRKGWNPTSLIENATGSGR